MGKHPLLSVNDLCVYFPKKKDSRLGKKSFLKAVDHVSFDIFPSEILSLVGESGSGKTTVARAILALATPTKGSIRYNEKELATIKGKDIQYYRRDVQIIYQDPFGSLSPRQDVFTTLAIPIRNLAEEKDKTKIAERVSRLLNEVGLDATEVLHKFPHQLSGGQRQRVNIARALSTDPKLLVADEPVTMLDASQRLKILSLIMQLKRNRNLTVLLITHDLASAKIMSNRTAVMYSGKIVEMGPTSRILSTPHHPYTELILSSTPRLVRSTEARKEISVPIESSQTVSNGCLFAPRCKYATEICREQEPELIEKSAEQFASCHNPLNI